MTLRNKRWHWPALALMAMTILTLSGSQCSQVADRAVGADTRIGTEGGGVSECVQACNELARAAREAERILHLANIEACAGDESCLEDEEARHEARMEEIAAQSQECKATCHEQGGGSGGE